MPDDINTPTGQDNTEGGGGGSEGAQDFSSMLPEDLRGNEHLSGFEDAGALAKAYVDLRGTHVVPQNPDGYELTFEKDYEVNDDAIKAFKEFAHNSGLTQKQVQAIIDFDRKRVLEHNELQQANAARAKEESDAALKKEFGGDYETRMTTAKKVIARFAPDGAHDLLGSHPAVVRFADAVGRHLKESMSEDVLIEGRPDAGGKERPAGPDGRPRLRFSSMGDK